MKTAYKIIDKLVYWMFLAGVVSGIFMTALVFVSTLMRYLFNSPVHFSNELAGLLFLSITFLTIPHVLNIDRHIKIDLVVKKLPSRIKNPVGVFASMVMIIFSLVFIYESWGFMNFSRLISSRSDISGILLWPWMILMPLSFVMCVVVKIKHACLFRGADEVNRLVVEEKS